MPSGIYLAIHGFLTIILAVRIIRLRWRHKVSVGHGENSELMIATRVFGNHNEYAALFLILLFALDFQNTSTAAIHVLGSAFTVGRIAHAIGLSKKPGRSFGRAVGMVLTFVSIAVASLGLAFKALL